MVATAPPLARLVVSAPAAVLFDFDGVLADSRLAITRSLNHGLAAVGAPERPATELERWIGPPLLHAFRALAGPSAPRRASPRTGSATVDVEPDRDDGRAGR